MNSAGEALKLCILSLMIMPVKHGHIILLLMMLSTLVVLPMIMLISFCLILLSKMKCCLIIEICTIGLLDWGLSVDGQNRMSRNPDHSGAQIPTAGHRRSGWPQRLKLFGKEVPPLILLYILLQPVLLLLDLAKLQK